MMRKTRKRNKMSNERLSHQSFYVLRNERNRNHDQVLDSCFAQFLQSLFSVRPERRIVCVRGRRIVCGRGSVCVRERGVRECVWECEGERVRESVVEREGEGQCVCERGRMTMLSIVMVTSTTKMTRLKYFYLLLTSAIVQVPLYSERTNGISYLRVRSLLLSVRSDPLLSPQKYL